MNVYLLIKCEKCDNIMDVTDSANKHKFRCVNCRNVLYRDNTIMVHGADNYEKANKLLKILKNDEVKLMFCILCGEFKGAKNCDCYASDVSSQD